MENITLYHYLEKEAFKRKMTITGLSLDMGFSKSALPRIKYQQQGPNIRSYYKMAEYLKIDPSELLSMPINQQHINK